MSDQLDAYRERFPILAQTCYLNNNSLGAMPAAVADGMDAYARIWRERGVRAWAEEWWPMPVEVGDLAAPILGAPQGSVSMHTNVTLATAVFFSSLRVEGARKKVVTTELQFPSIQYFLDRWCRRNGAELCVVPCTDGLGADPERLLGAI
ncbi:MAG: hypothetical protein V3T24_09520, partial [Longimicrobiales bacterium]